MPAEEASQLILVAARDRRDDLAQGRPAEAESAALGGWKRPPAHIDGGPAQVVLAQGAEVSAEDPRFLERGCGRAHGGAGAGEFKHSVSHILDALARQGDLS